VYGTGNVAPWQVMTTLPNHHIDRAISAIVFIALR
jgi:hypothetical protein